MFDLKFYQKFSDQETKKLKTLLDKNEVRSKWK